jgi:FtsK/SpoIIIE family
VVPEVRPALTTPVEPFDPPDSCEGLDLAALPVAIGEDGLVHRVRLLGAHLLVVGATGSGKGSVIWSLIAALAPGIRDGLVQVWAVDPKGGMELAPGRALLTRFVYGDPDDNALYELDFAHVLEDAVFVMRRRQATLRGRTRMHSPRLAEPLVVVVIDELASLTAYVVDRDAKRRITAALSLRCCPKAGRSGCRWSVRSKIPARTSCPCGTCSRPESCCGSPNPNTSPSPSAKERGTEEPAPTSSTKRPPVWPTSARTG